MRLLTRLFYGCIVLDSLGVGAASMSAQGLPVLTPAAFRQAVADERLASGTPETAYAFAKMSLTAFLRGLQSSEFEEAVNVIAQG